MATPVTYVANQYSIPAYNDTGYAQGAGNLSSYLVALATGSLTLSGGSFPLTADANFGGSFGLVSLYLKSTTANLASTGFLRMAKTDSIAWRNNANSADKVLSVDASDRLLYAANIIFSAAGVAPIGAGGTNSSSALVNGKIMASSGGAIVEVGADSSMNSHKITSLANGTAAADAAAFGQVTMIQYTGPTFTQTQTDSTSNSYADVTNLSLSITPKLSTSHVLIEAILTVRGLNSGAQFTIADLEITDSSNNVIKEWLACEGIDATTANANVYQNVKILAWDAPGSTSSKTYKVRGRRTVGGSGTINFNVSGAGTYCVIHAWEYNQ